MKYCVILEGILVTLIATTTASGSNQKNPNGSSLTIALLNSSIPMHHPNHTNKHFDNMHKAMKECNKTFPISREVSTYLWKNAALEDESIENDRCFVECMATKMNVIKDGEFNADGIKQMLEMLSKHAARRYGNNNPNKNNNKKNNFGTFDLKQEVSESFNVTEELNKLNSCSSQDGTEKCEKGYKIAKCVRQAIQDIHTKHFPNHRGWHYTTESPQ